MEAAHGDPFPPLEAPSAEEIMTWPLDDVTVEFLSEARDGLDAVEEDLLCLETDPTDKPRLDAVFRVVHSIKGTAGMLDYGRLESIAHAGETLMAKVREGAMPLENDAITALLQALDAMRTDLDAIGSTGAGSDDDAHELIELLESLAAAGTPEEESAGGEFLEFLAPPASSDDLSGLDAALASLDIGSGDLAGIEAALSAIAPHIPETPAPPAAPAPHKQAKAKAKAKANDGAPPAETHIRVDVRVLDKLMNLVGELVLVRNRLVQRADETGSASRQLDHITTELQDGVMKTRMQTVGTVISRVPRVVRDLCMTFDKRVEVRTSGEETEVDRTIVQAIKDPLTHLVRNAVDHGIEMPEARIAAGKPAAGRLELRAYQDGGQVTIEISDDGKGIDVQKVAKRALERGLVTATELERMGDEALTDLIFRPGFSTAEAVTTVSGRGVGMDVVRTRVEQVGGTVEVSSELGKGTTFRLRIPLTLAIIQTLLVEAGGTRYALPQSNLDELIRVTPDEWSERISEMGGAEVLDLRGEFLPLVRLAKVLDDPAHDSALNALNVVVLRSGRQRYALVVDEIIDTEEIVVKPLGPMLSQVGLYSGATVLGDGTVAVILDVTAIARTAGLVTTTQRTTTATEDDTAGERVGLLTFTAGPLRHAAIPLARLERIEELAAERIEYAAGKPVFQHVDDLVPLFFLSSILGEPHTVPEVGTIRVLVCPTARGRVGIVIDRILDLVESEVENKRRVATAHPALSATAVVQGKVTDMVDIDALVDAPSAPVLAAIA
jgi:two-component system chemotaxis sensor kinase CheA